MHPLEQFYVDHFLQKIEDPLQEFKFCKSEIFGWKALNGAAENIVRPLANERHIRSGCVIEEILWRASDQGGLYKLWYAWPRGTRDGCKHREQRVYLIPAT